MLIVASSKDRIVQYSFYGDVTNLRVNLKTLVYGEFLFSLFVVSGFFKASLDKIIHFDISILLLFLTLFIAGKRFLKNGMSVRKYVIIPFIIFVLFFIAIIISYTYTPSVYYANDKIVRFAIITSWCFLGSMILARDENSIKSFLNGLAFLSSIMSVVAIGSYLMSSGGIGFVNVLGSNYLSLAISTAVGGLIFFCRFIFENTNRLLNFLLFLLNMIGLFVSGARMPVIAVVMALSLLPLFIVSYRNKDFMINKRMLLVLVGGVSIFLIGLTLFIASGFADTFIYRITLAFTSGGDSVNARVDRFETAFQMILGNAFGNGFGSFPIFYSGEDAEDYPHNIFLEIWSEIGIFGLTLYCLLLLIALYKGVSIYKRYHGKFTSTQVSVILSALLLFFIFNVSGSINGSKLLWMFMGIMIVSPYMQQKEKTNIL